MIKPPPHEDLFEVIDGEFVISDQATEEQRKEILEWIADFETDDDPFEGDEIV